MNVVGIDPGLSGALAYLTDTTASVFDMPITAGLHNTKMVNSQLISDVIASDWPYDFVIIERPTFRHGNSAKSTINTFFNYGRLTACFESWGEVEPAAWKKQMGLSKDKMASLEMAIALFPSLTSMLARNKDHGRAEALLIAEWFRRASHSLGAVLPPFSLSVSAATSFPTHQSEIPDLH